MESQNEKFCLSVSEAARKLGIGRNSMYEAVKRGDVPVIRIGKRILIPISALSKKLSGVPEK